MKKLTAGILTVMLGIVSANSADAAVASKGYVDAKVKTNADAIAQEVTDRGTAITNLSTSLTTEIGKKVDTSTYEAGVQSLQSQIDAKQVKLKVASDSAIKLADDGTMSLEGIATSTELAGIQSTITKLDGAETVDGSVKKQIADAIASEVTRSDGYADAAEQAAKDYADGLINAEVSRADAAYATAAQGELAASALQQADITTGEANGTISVDGTDVTVKGLGSAAYTDADAYDVSGAAAQALADAKADTDSKIANLALQAISKVPAECSNMTKYCVLTYGTNGFVWEVIERADGETGGSSADTTQP